MDTIDRPNLEDFTIIWLSDSANSNNVQNELREIINYVKIFHNVDQCIEYVSKAVDDNIFIVLSVSTQSILETIHDLKQIELIYIFPAETINNSEYEKWSKVVGIFINKETLLRKLTKDIELRMKNSLISISIFSINSTIEEKSTREKYEASFLWFQLVLEVLLHLPQNNRGMSEMLNECRLQYANNQSQIDSINDFEANYKADKAIWWYTRDSFVYRIINRALRTQNIDIIFKFRYFITDLYTHLLELHKEFLESLPPIESDNDKVYLDVYRGQAISPDELNNISKSIGKLISMNTFLSTTMNKGLGMVFAGVDRPINDPKRSVLFHMTVDTSIHTFPFYIIPNSAEDEVLFSMGIIFKIDSIEQNGNMYIVKLTLNNDENKDIEQFIEFLRKEINHSDTTLATLGNFLVYSNEYDKAETYYQILLNELPLDHEDIPTIYNNIGLVYDLKGNHTHALQYYNKSLAFLDNVTQDKQSSLALHYNNLAATYFAKKDYDTAILYYNMTLKVQTNLADLATTYNNLGTLSREIGDFDSALKSFTVSLEMSLKCLPIYHPDLAATYALNYFQEALKLELSHEFLSLSAIHSDIAEIYHKKHEYDLALQSYNECLNIQLNHLPPHLEDQATTYRNIALVYKSKNDLTQIITYYNKCLDIYKMILPSNHPDLSSLYHDLAMTYHEVRNYEAAIVALKHEQESLPLGDSHIPMTYENLAINYDEISKDYYLNGNYQQAIDTLKKSLHIQLQQTPNDDELILLISNDIESITAEMKKDRTKRCGVGVGEGEGVSVGGWLVMVESDHLVKVEGIALT
ncbi:hypothetical protein I4U23_005420 [Adineta vaga]|nr:hypothetical protein I4U23_005420 [Adineta vaga]